MQMKLFASNCTSWKKIVSRKRRQVINSVISEPESVYSQFVNHKSLRTSKNKVALWVIKLFVRLLKNTYLRLASSLLYQLTKDDVMKRIMRSFRLHLCASQCIACVRYWILRKCSNGNVADSSRKLSMQMLLLICLLCDESLWNATTYNVSYK